MCVPFGNKSETQGDTTCQRYTRRLFHGIRSNSLMILARVRVRMCIGTRSRFFPQIGHFLAALVIGKSSNPLPKMKVCPFERARFSELLGSSTNPTPLHL